MAFQEIIARKRDGSPLTRSEIGEFVNGYLSGVIPDYQASALLMAILIRGMNTEETFALTEFMLKSGKVLSLDAIRGLKIDKHSTGGVGDKVSLMLAPMVASCGVVVPMVSGRGLGHTGGTLDKLESIPGYRTGLSINEFKKILKKCGVSIIGQTSDIAPADKKIYALRDVTATVESIPLITASILSKKLASGTDGILFDIKCGNGAFMKTIEDAEALAKSLVKTSHKFGKMARAVITSMDQPLGNAVGNSLEVIEVIEYLKGKRPADLDEVVISLGVQMLLMGGIAKSAKKAEGILIDSIDNGSALRKFEEFVKLQGGDVRVVDDPSLLDIADRFMDFKASRDGYISSFDTLKVGLAANTLGAGRKRIEDKVDFGVGFIFRRKLGERVRRGDVIAEIYARNKSAAGEASRMLSESIRITSRKPKLPPRIIKLIK